MVSCLFTYRLIGPAVKLSYEARHPPPPPPPPTHTPPPVQRPVVYSCNAAKTLQGDYQALLDAIRHYYLPIGSGECPGYRKLLVLIRRYLPLLDKAKSLDNPASTNTAASDSWIGFGAILHCFKIYYSVRISFSDRRQRPSVTNPHVVKLM